MKRFANINDRVKHVAFISLWLFALVSAIYQGYLQNRPWFIDPHVEQTARVFAAADVDDAAFLHDVSSHSSLSGPLFWWHNGWHGNRYPYYWRPLTMLGFWTEYHVFGAYRFDRWQVADIVFNLIFLLLLGYFAVRVTRSRFAGPLSVLVFTCLVLVQIPEFTPFILGFTTPDAHIVLCNWKDQPEQWGGFCTLASLILAMRARWLPAIAFSVASVCFKESGWLTFPMLLFTALMTGSFRKVPKSAWAAAIASCVALVALRASAGHNVLFPPHDPNNEFGFVRFANHVVDPNLRELTGELWPVVPSGIVFALLILTKRLRLITKSLAAIAVCGATSGLIAFSHRTDIATGFACLVDWNSGLRQFVEMTVYAVVMIVAFRHRPLWRQTIYLYGLVLISDLLEMAVLQPNAHMLYLTNGFQSVLVVAIALAFLRQCRSAVPEPDSTSTPEPATATV